MNYRHLAAGTFTAMLALAACGRSEEPSPAPESAASNQLLAYVPADTPYLAANLEPVPEDILDAFLSRLQPVFDSMQEQLTITRNDLASSAQDQESTGSAGTAGTEADPRTRLVLALLQELDGNLDREGLERLGIDLRSHKVVYGLGVFPVIRLGLTDPSILRATVQRVLDNAQLSAPQHEYQGQRFWRLSDGDPANAPTGLYLSILDDHLAISVFPPMVEEELLPAFLGLQLPGDSGAAAMLGAFTRSHGYTPHGSGILDIRKLADRFMTPGTTISKVMAAHGDFDAESLPPECVSEIHSIIDNAPRITMGVTELTASTAAVQYRVETPPSLASQLMGLVAKIPGIDKQSRRMLELAFGMRFGAVRDFILEKATAIAEQPYQCEHLQRLNDSATQTLAQLNQPMPPFVNNFRGIRLSLSDVAIAQGSIPENARGHLAVHVEQPEMFVGMAQMMLPDLSEISLVAGDPPVLLPESLTQLPGLVAYAAMSADAIGLSFGAGEELGLPDYLDRELGPEDTFLTISYDMAAYLDYSGELGRNHAQAENEETFEHRRAAEAAGEIAAAARTAFKEMADRSLTTLSFTEEGFVADNRMTFK